MCGFNCLSLFKCMLRDQCFIKIQTWSEYIIPYKTEVATDVTDVKMLLILIMNKNVTVHPNSSYDQMCISKRQKSDIIIIHIMRQPKPVS